MTREGRPAEALFLIRVASLLVPGADRPNWVREWRGELMAHWTDASSTASSRALRWRLCRRALGSLVDAARFRARSGAWRGLSTDVRVAARNLVRRPLFSVLVLVTLAVGIGANATLFGVARSQLLKPFPYPDADRVVAVLSQSRERTGFLGNVSYPNMADLAEASTTLSHVAVIRHWQPALEDVGGAIVLRGATVTANFFALLGMEPGAGRFFLEPEGVGGEPVVVLSHGFWRTRYGGDPGAVGSEISLNGTRYRIVGVTSEGFEDPWLLGGPGQEPQVWRSERSPPSEWPRSGRSWRGMARLRADASLEAADAEVSALMAALESEYPDDNAGRTLELVPLRDRVAGPVRPAILMLLGSVGLLLLVATANLAGLLLGRALDREREFVVQRALGASGWRIVRGGMTEAALLALLGGVLGLALTGVLSIVVERLGSAFLPRPMDVGLGAPVVLFAGAVTVSAGLLVGLVPSLHASRAAAEVPGKREGRGFTTGRSGNRTRHALVVAQLAMTTVLLVGSGLVLRSFARLGSSELGLEPRGAVALELHGSAWWNLTVSEAQSQWDAVLESVRELPQVRSAGAIDYVPFDGSYSCDGIRRDDLPEPPAGEGLCAEVRSVLPGVVEALGVPLLRGRHLGPRDRADAPPVALIDESLAATHWPGEDPLGRRVNVHGNVHEVVGVVGDMQHFGPGALARPMLLIPSPQDGWNGVARGLWLVVRSDAATDAVVNAVRSAVHRVNPAIAIGTVSTLDRLLARTLAAPRFRSLVLGLFAGAALVLALLGVGGVVSFSVARRTRELGVRLALGAHPAAVRRLVIREGLVLTWVGVAIGTLAGLALTRAAESLLFEVSPRDPGAFLGAVVLIVGAGAVACAVPAYKASRLDPVTALSADG